MNGKAYDKSLTDRGRITFFDIEEVGFYTKNIDGNTEKVTCNGQLKLERS